MKKTVYIFLILFFCSLTSFPQVKFIANLGYKMAIGDFIGSFSNNHNGGIGLSGGVEYYVQESNVAISADIGYTQINISSRSSNILTYSGGIKFFFKSKGSTLFPYFGSKVGLLKSKIMPINNSSVLLALQAGLRFQKAPDATAVDFNIQYNNSSSHGYNISFIGFNLGLAFNL